MKLGRYCWFVRRKCTIFDLKASEAPENCLALLPALPEPPCRPEAFTNAALQIVLNGLTEAHDHERLMK